MCRWISRSLFMNGGAALKAHCEARLKAAEEKVAQITLGEGGQPRGMTPVTGLLCLRLGWRGPLIWFRRILI